MKEDVRPLVSISCVTYNHAPYLKQCLDGFFMQQCKFDFEMLLHDDASTDGSQDIIKEYMTRYPGIIKPIFQTENQYSKGVRSMSMTFNAPRAQGKYIALCESDDYWTDPLKLQKQVDFLDENPEYGGVSTNNRIFYQKESSFEDSILEAGKISFEDLCTSNKINSQTVLYKKDLVRELEWMSDLEIGDWALHLLVASQQPYYRLADVTTVYRIHAGGVHSLLDEEIKLRRRVEVLLAVNQNFELTVERQTILNSSIAELYKRLLNYKSDDIGTIRRNYLKYGGTYFNKTVVKSFINEFF